MKYRWPLIIPSIVILILLAATIDSFRRQDTTDVIFWSGCLVFSLTFSAILFYEFIYKPERNEKNRKANAPKYKISYLPSVSPIKTICGNIFPVTSRDDFAGGNVVYLVADQPATPHYHRETTEFYIVVDGYGSLWLDEEEMPLRRGVVTIIYPGTVHNIAPVPGNTLKVWVVAVPAWCAEDEIEVDENSTTTRRKR